MSKVKVEGDGIKSFEVEFKEARAKMMEAVEKGEMLQDRMDLELAKMQEDLKKEYGTDNINIHTGEINHEDVKTD